MAEPELDMDRKKLRRIVLARDRYRCVYCESELDLTVDHVLPLSHGGAARNPRNCVCACRACNELRGNQFISHWLRYLASEGLDVRAIEKRIARRLKRRTPRKHRAKKQRRGIGLFEGEKS